MTCVYSLFETVTELSQHREMRFSRFLVYITILKAKAASEALSENGESKEKWSNSFEFPKLDWSSPKTFMGYISNFTHRVADIVNDVKLDSLSENELFDIPQLPTDFEFGDFNLTEIENFILNSIRNFSRYS